MNYFISDLHFNHTKILKYDNRPFKNVEEMNETIIKNWNKMVKNEDIVYILGDIGFGESVKIVNILNRLNGEKVLITGNHDHKLLKNKEFKDCFKNITPYKEIYEDNIKIILSHYPIFCYNGSYRGSYMLYGHVHNTKDYELINKCKKIFDDEKIECNMINVGCCMSYMNYTPRTFSELKKYK